MRTRLVAVRRLTTLLLFVTVPVVGRCGSPILLNEVLYDPSGADGGAEFVELINTGSTDAGLDGVRLLFTNGSGAAGWEIRWTGDADDSIPAGGLFLIGDRGWSGTAPGATAALGLQNGPDALRLLLPDGGTDTIGYGALDRPDLFEGSPHPGASGLSLARRPDGFDSDDNAADWRAATPTPGAANWALRSVTVDDRRDMPPSLPGPGACRLVLRLSNTGLMDLPEGMARLRADGGLFAIGSWPGAAADETVELPFDGWFGSSGTYRLDVELDIGDTTLHRPAGAYRVGPEGLVLNEIMAAPDAVSCEWIELLAVDPLGVDLADYALRDADGAARPLPPLGISGGDRVLIVQDPAAFSAWHAELSAVGAPWPCPELASIPGLQIPTAGWPSLNNTPPAGREYADRIELLRVAENLVIDHVLVGDGGRSLETGRSLERVAVEPRGDPAWNWGPSTAAIGATPGCPNSLRTREETDGLVAEPNPFVAVDRGGAGVSFGFHLAATERAWCISIQDLWGDRLRELPGEALGAGPRTVFWDGRGDDGASVANGPLVVVLVVRDVAGRTLRRERLLLVCDDEAAAG